MPIIKLTTRFKYLTPNSNTTYRWQYKLQNAACVAIFIILNNHKTTNLITN